MGLEKYSALVHSLQTLKKNKYSALFLLFQLFDSIAKITIGVIHKLHDVTGGSG